jgi:hypothetical protein
MWGFVVGLDILVGGIGFKQLAISPNQVFHCKKSQ